MKFVLYRIVNGKRYRWGTYRSPVLLARAAFELGKSGVQNIEFEVIQEEQEG